MGQIDTETMNEDVPNESEKGKVSFAIYIYPFEATNIAPSRGGVNVERILIDDPGVSISRKETPWELVREDALWWISLDRSWIQDVGMRIPSNVTQYELEFLMTALNICVDTKVFFTRFARKYYDGIIMDGEISSPSGFYDILEVLERPVPSTVSIDGDRFYALSSRIIDEALSETHSDLNKAIETYRAAIQSFNTEIHARLLYSVCEKVLFQGSPNAKEKDVKIAEISSLDEEEARAWRHLVNRTKHPDEGTNYSWSDTFEDVPPPVEFRMREAANEALRRDILRK